ncbi:MAG TPA: TadE/TadG family type IV pilus assembly protein [Rhizomicrobium sp.]|nr:TadE/TadG family type IV pilus assembly protein [Rhizomicrobium sp.]
MHPILRRLLAAKRANSGIAAVEFAFIVPIFLVLFAGIADVSQMLYAYYELDQAVAAGSQYAVLNAANVTSTTGAALASSIATVVENANGSAWTNDTVVVNNGPTVTVTNGTASSSGTAANADKYYCITGSQGSWTWGTAYTSQSSCSPSGTAGKYVTITASYSYVPLVGIYHVFTNSTLHQSAAVRVQ